MVPLPAIDILKDNGEIARNTIIQAGMAIGISSPRLARQAASRGLVGTVASAGSEKIWSALLNRKVSAREGAYLDVRAAKRDGGFIAINCMYAIGAYRDAVYGALDAGVDAIISGAGIPLELPAIVAEYAADHPGLHRPALIPIISTARALGILIRRWERQACVPDAVVLEGPLAGGHLGFNYEALGREDSSLDAQYPLIKALAEKYGFPVIVAGGVYDRSDISSWHDLGAGGVQIGTRFLATVESGASEDFKRRLVSANKSDIIVAKVPGSPCGLPFRILKDSPGYWEASEERREPYCSQSLLIKPGRPCPAAESCRYFCICNNLLSALELRDYAYPDTYDISGSLGDALPIYTTGALGCRIDRIMPADELIDELTGKKTTCNQSPA